MLGSRDIMMEALGSQSMYVDALGRLQWVTASLSSGNFPANPDHNEGLQFSTGCCENVDINQNVRV